MQIPVDLTGKEERISCLDAADLWKDDSSPCSTCSGDKFLCLILFVDFISWRRLLVCYLRFYFCCCAWVLMFIFWHTVVMERYTTGFAREMNSRCVALGLSSLGRRQRGVWVFAISINGPWSFERICIPCCLILRPRLHMSCFYYI